MAEIPTESELDDLEALAPARSDIAFELERGPDGRAWVRPTAEAKKAHAAVPRLVAAVRALRKEAERLESELRRTRDDKRASPAAAAKKPSAAADAGTDELGSLLSAPFTVSPRAVSAAKSDPLVALGVQVARALVEDAKEIERARLIAMAFAAVQGDLERFWEARKQRSPGKLTAAKPARGPA